MIFIQHDNIVLNGLVCYSTIELFRCFDSFVGSGLTFQIGHSFAVTNLAFS